MTWISNLILKKTLKEGVAMEKILFINACLRENSRTLELAKHVLKKVQGTLEEVKLYDINPAPLNLDTMKIRDIAKNNGSALMRHPFFP